MDNNEIDKEISVAKDNISIIKNRHKDELKPYIDLLRRLYKKKGTSQFVMVDDTGNVLFRDEHDEQFLYLEKPIKITICPDRYCTGYGFGLFKEHDI